MSTSPPSHGATDVLSQPGDRRLSPLPFAHVGYMTRAWDEIANAVTTIITPTPWRADEAVRILESERVTVAQGVPTQWALMLASDELDRADLNALRVAGTGAARMPASMVAEMRRRLGVPVVVRYTSTESSLGTGTTLTSSDEEVATTVGKPVAGVELAIVDDDGRPVPDGSVGRVLLRSAAAMRGYWGGGPGRGRSVRDLVDAVATRGVLAPDGWVTTGDFGRRTPQGNLQLSGRAHERYIRGGYNVYPAEVEEVLATHAIGGAGRGLRCARRCARRGRRGGDRRGPRLDAASWTCCAHTAAACWPTTRRLTPSSWWRSCL